MKLLALLALFTACGARSTPPSHASDPPAHAVPVEIDWPDAGTAAVPPPDAR